MRFFLIIILFVSFFFRIFQLSSTPSVLLEKEVLTGLLAKAMVTHDKLLMNNLNQFATYIAPLPVYFTSSFITIFGLNEWSVRMPSAFFGTFTVFLFFSLLNEVKKRTSLFSENEILIATTIYGLSFWHMQISRIDIGTNVGIFFLLLAFYCFIKFLDNEKFILITIPLLILSIYSDYSFFIPSTLLFVFGLYYVAKKRKIKMFSSLLPAIFFLILLLPIVNNIFLYYSKKDDTSVYWDITLEQKATNRIIYSGNTLAAHILHDSTIEKTKLYLSRFTDYIEPRSLFFNWDKNVDSLNPYTGLFSPIELVFLILGLFYISRNRQKLMLCLLLFFILTIFPFTINKSSPNMLITSLFIPLFAVFISKSLNFYMSFLEKNSKMIILPFIIISYIYFLGRFSYMYFLKYPADENIQVKYIQAFSYIETHAKNAGIVYVTDVTFGKNIFLYFLFYEKSHIQSWKTTKITQEISINNKKYIFLTETPKIYSVNTLYIQPTKNSPNEAKLIHQTEGKDDRAISIFTL